MFGDWLVLIALAGVRTGLSPDILPHLRLLRLLLRGAAPLRNLRKFVLPLPTLPLARRRATAQRPSQIVCRDSGTL